MKWLAVAIVALSLGISTYLFMENRKLRAQLISSKGSLQTASPDPDATSLQERPRTSKGSLATTPDLLTRLGSGHDARERPSLKEPERESRAERRERRREKMRDLLGRRPGETEDGYRQRVRPVVVAGLAKPRMEMESARREAEEAAGISGQQREAIDEILQETFEHSLELANEAVSNRELDPYQRNWAGALSVAGGFGAVLSTTNEQISDILSSTQRQTLMDIGFEWGEYIGAKTPWEELSPPPPPLD